MRRSNTCKASSRSNTCKASNSNRNFTSTSTSYFPSHTNNSSSTNSTEPCPHRPLTFIDPLPSSTPYLHRSLMVRRTNISAELLVEPVSPASIAKKDSMGRRFKVDNPIVTDPNKRFLRMRSLSNTFTFIRS